MSQQVQVQWYGYQFSRKFPCPNLCILRWHREFHKHAVHFKDLIVTHVVGKVHCEVCCKYCKGIEWKWEGVKTTLLLRKKRKGKERKVWAAQIGTSTQSKVHFLWNSPPHINLHCKSWIRICILYMAQCVASSGELLGWCEYSGGCRAQGGLFFDIWASIYICSSIPKCPWHQNGRNHWCAASSQCSCCPDVTMVCLCI